MKQQSETKIAVIGAGLAGLTAATRLRSQGFQVDVYEKSRGVGGRMSTRREAWAQLDLGAQYFTARSPAFRDQVARWVKTGVAAPWKFTPHRVESGHLRPSPDSTQRYVGTPKMNMPSRQLSEAVEVYCNIRIEGIEHDGSGWLLQGAPESKRSPYDWVISSAPAEQCKTLFRGTDLGEAVPATMHSPCWAVALGTRGHIEKGIQGIFGDETVAWVARQSQKPGRSAPVDCDDAWVIHFSPHWSEQHEQETEPDLAGAAAEWLQRRLGKVLEVRHHHLHFWRYANLAGDGLDMPYLIDTDQHLAVIGAWCCGGRVEGAFLSGMALAEQLARQRNDSHGAGSLNEN